MGWLVLEAPLSAMSRAGFGVVRARGRLAALALLATLGLVGGTWARFGQSHAQLPPTCAPDAGTTVCVLPATQSVTAGSNFDIDVVVDDVANLGAFEVTVAFDPSIVGFGGATYGSFLGSSGREPICFSPSILAGSVRFTCVTTAPGGTGPPGPPGPDGSGVLVTASFAVLNAGTSLLSLTTVILTDVTGAPIAHLDQDGQIIGGPAFTPTPCDGACPTATPTLAPTLTPTAGPGPAIVRVDPASQDQLKGSLFSVDIVVENVANLGAYQFSLAWNPDVLGFVNIGNGAFLSSSGRTTFCFDPTIGVNTVSFGCVTTGSVPPGATGSGVLAQVVFSAVDASAGPSPLDLFNVALSTPLGTDIPVSAVDGAVTVQEAPTRTPTPCPGGICPTPTITPTPTETPTPTATPLPVFCAPGPGTRVCVLPSSITVPPSTYFSVDIVVDDVANLGAYEFTLEFDPNTVAFAGIENGPFLGSTGRTVSCLTPALTVSSVRFTCATLGALPNGPSGSGVLATVTLLALASGTSPLNLRDTKLTDISGTPLPIAEQDGAVTVFHGPTPTATTTPTPTDTPTAGPSPTPTPIVGTVTFVDPASQSASAGTNFAVEISIQDVTDLASYEFQLAFDPSLVDFVSTVNGPLLGSTGRTVFCLPPLLPPAVPAGNVRFGCVTSGISPPPPSGAGILATVTLSAVAPGDSVLDLVFVSLSDPLANDIPTAVLDGSVTVVATPALTPTPTATPLARAAPLSKLGTDLWVAALAGRTAISRSSSDSGLPGEPITVTGAPPLLLAGRRRQRQQRCRPGGDTCAKTKVSDAIRS